MHKISREIVRPYSTVSAHLLHAKESHMLGISHGPITGAL